MKKGKLKQVKSFTLDGDIYNWLVEKIRMSGSDLSLSSLVDDYLGYLHYELKTLLDYCEREEIEIDRSWLVSTYIEDIKMSQPNWNVIEKLSEEVRKDFEKDMKLQLEWDVEHLLRKYKEEKKKMLELVKQRKRARQLKVAKGVKGR